MLKQLFHIINMYKIVKLTNNNYQFNLKVFDFENSLENTHFILCN